MQAGSCDVIKSYRFPFSLHRHMSDRPSVTSAASAKLSFSFACKADSRVPSSQSNAGLFERIGLKISEIASTTRFIYPQCCIESERRSPFAFYSPC